MINTDKRVKERLQTILKCDPKIHWKVKGKITKNLSERPEPNFQNIKQDWKLLRHPALGIEPFFGFLSC